MDSALAFPSLIRSLASLSFLLSHTLAVIPLFWGRLQVSMACIEPDHAPTQSRSWKHFSHVALILCSLPQHRHNHSSPSLSKCCSFHFGASCWPSLSSFSIKSFALYVRKDDGMTKAYVEAVGLVSYFRRKIYSASQDFGRVFGQLEQIVAQNTSSSQWTRRDSMSTRSRSVF